MGAASVISVLMLAQQVSYPLGHPSRPMLLLLSEVFVDVHAVLGLEFSAFVNQGSALLLSYNLISALVNQGSALPTELYPHPVSLLLELNQHHWVLLHPNPFFLPLHCCLSFLPSVPSFPLHFIV